jgi:hypothetical protein
MSLSDYFENSKGTGILGTADSEGNVDPFMQGLM